MSSTSNNASRAKFASSTETSPLDSRPQLVLNESLKQETEKLSRSWMQHEAGWLRDYLVAGVEDPRINLQSILSRHFLVRAVAGDHFANLMREECRFGAVMNWALDLASKLSEAEEREAVLHALGRDADNAEGLEIPQFVVQAFGSLPISADGQVVGNYLETFLKDIEIGRDPVPLAPRALATFQEIWRGALAGVNRAAGSGPSVLEPACGSANDYRWWQEFGVAPWIDYTGFDLCGKNVENARELFPHARFEEGNVFQIDARDKAFDLCVVHDLFEHLSLEGLEQAASEICRVTRQGICAGFFQMDEVAEHVVRPLDEYHWNLLSLRRTRELFARHGFAAQVVHIGTFLRDQFGCEHTHNPNAYTLILRTAA